MLAEFVSSSPFHGNRGYRAKLSLGEEEIDMS
jgi:hypothetical protein